MRGKQRDPLKEIFLKECCIDSSSAKMISHFLVKAYMQLHYTSLREAVSERIAFKRLWRVEKMLLTGPKCF